ncbi:helix-turn-helix domain-containing protein [Streptomyces sp. GMY02]|uniref:helix-turn-helix domain-containing protein n=1 Tax=Streptomyces sp. GMY02 TaxID=1333528 RepID=UPI001C2C0604|nr:helix-turn-helix transcriptional regulator [Streptomyces sp. GMY02]QXE36943.1 helix-turn-helix domain-containing protein [Streptomyces sp. GMY02]
MDTTAWPVENWATLGEQIAKARRGKGWDQAELARRSGNSPNTISNYERGRPTQSRRIPTGLLRVAQALGWPPDAVQEILSGTDPAWVVGQPDLFSLAGEHAKAVPAAVSSVEPKAPGFMNAELLESGALAHDAFVRQMKRYRKLQGVSPEELAERIAEIGGELSVNDLKRLENGTRIVRPDEGELIAQALGSTVDWIVGSGFAYEAPDAMKVPPTADELQTEAKAMEQRMTQAGMRVNGARMQLEQARQAEAAARRQAQVAMAVLTQAEAVQRDIERSYQYLLGRIDSIRAANGDDLIIQSYPVYEESDRQSGQ